MILTILTWPFLSWDDPILRSQPVQVRSPLHHQKFDLLVVTWGWRNRLKLDRKKKQLDNTPGN